MGIPKKISPLQISIPPPSGAETALKPQEREAKTERSRSSTSAAGSGGLLRLRQPSWRREVRKTEDGAHGELAASSRRKRSASAAHPQEDDAPQEPGDGAASPRTKNAAAAVEEAQWITSPTSKSTASLWEEVVRKKHKKPRSMLHQEAPPPHFPQSSQGKECFICKKEGHLAKDCARNKKWNTRQPKFSLRCEGMGHGMTEFAKGCLKNDIKHIEGEDSCHLDSLCAAKVDDPEEIAHKMYWKKVSLCKKDFTFCLICHLNGGEASIEKDTDKVRKHCNAIHKADGFKCDKKGCVARAKTKHDIGVHHDLCHGIKRRETVIWAISESNTYLQYMSMELMNTLSGA
ncbi:hypothetical protein ACP70R_008305 [Stipagrostis hirtigluma subsp. patula]